MNDIDFVGLADSGKAFGRLKVERTFHFHLEAGHAEVVHLFRQKSALVERKKAFGFRAVEALH